MKTRKTHWSFLTLNRMLSEVFVVDTDGDFWPASEFFWMKDIESFET